MCICILWGIYVYKIYIRKFCKVFSYILYIHVFVFCWAFNYTIYICNFVRYLVTCYIYVCLYFVGHLSIQYNIYVNFVGYLVTYYHYIYVYLYFVGYLNIQYSCIFCGVFSYIICSYILISHIHILCEDLVTNRIGMSCYVHTYPKYNRFCSK